MGSLAKDAKYRSVKNVSCPKCYTGHVDCVVKIPNDSREPELVYAECEPLDCKFDKEHREKLLRNCLEFIREYEVEKERRRLK